MRKYLLTILIIFSLKNQAHARLNGTEKFFVNIVKKMHLGMSLGVGATPIQNEIKTRYAGIFIVDKRAYLIKIANGDKTNDYFLMQWPYDVYAKINADRYLYNKLMDEFQKRLRKKYKFYNVKMLATGWTLPIRFIIKFEFGQRLRLGIEPSIDLLYIPSYTLGAYPPKGSDKKPKLIGRYIPEKRFSYYVAFPFFIEFVFYRNRYVNLLLAPRAGMRIPSYFSKGKPVDIELFWDFAFGIESNTRANVRPFIKINYGRMDSPDTRLDDQKKIAVVLFSMQSIFVEAGVTFKIIPDLDKCIYRKCSILESHNHGGKTYRGRSYFNEYPSKKERKLTL